MPRFAGTDEKGNGREARPTQDPQHWVDPRTGSKVVVGGLKA